MPKTEQTPRNNRASHRSAPRRRLPWRTTIRANTARGLVIENNTLDTSTIPTVVILGQNSRSVWIKDSSNASYVSGAGSPQPNLTLGGRLILGNNASLVGNGNSVEVKLENGSGYAQLIAQSFKQSAGPSWTSGAGAPATACTSGSLYSRTDGGPKSSLYVCEGGTWAAK